ncbi:trifunctional purine biosynthetic protein adenosine-3-like [Amphiprion ocellaris]|uniref:trifunctional purine biosynthetic protein adenosine-3-like n=1 Tax=Amphiprion ocellaris TaxID=80972 RepID=UPI002410B87E|nr:trifunctional purine biosynthetic protein adenosine-3-like [Amphiprion ocellaris]
MPPAQDHKRLQDGDQGPNTGGMGAYCPTPQVSQELLQQIRESVLQKTVDGMREEGTPYVGVLYAGLMLTNQGPKVLEFNCRFGDPECQKVCNRAAMLVQRICHVTT